MTPIDIEQAVFQLEEVRIVIRAPITAQLGDFNYARKAAGTSSIAEWLDQRIYPLIGEFGVVVIDGTGAHPHRRTRMNNLRDSYVS